jgi:5-hydroxyisourate hydrolase-like protein (transthyretin family)
MDAQKLRRQVTLAALLAPALFAQNSGSVEGSVINSATRLGVDGVKVEVTQQDQGDVRQIQGVESDASGRFRVPGLSPGKYLATFEKEGFADPQSDGTAEIHFTITGGAQPASIKVELMPRSTLRGRILDADGKPMPKMRVRLLRIRYPGAYEAETDKEGRYVFENVRPTAYVIAAIPPAGADAPKPPPSKVKEYLIWGRTFYPGTLDRLQAAPVVIPAGAEIAGYDYRMLATPGYRVRGKAVTSEGKPATDGTVHLYSAEDDEELSVTTKVDRDGNFAIDDVPAGSWRCVVQIPKVHKFTVATKQVNGKDAEPVQVGVLTLLDPSGAAGELVGPPDKTETGSIKLDIQADHLIASGNASIGIDNPPDAEIQKQLQDAQTALDQYKRTLFVLSNGDLERGAVTFDLKRPDLDPLEIHLSRTFFLPFMAVRIDRGSSDPKAASSTILLKQTDGGHHSIGPLEHRDGKAFEQVPAGRYHAVEGESSGTYLAAVMLGDRDVLGQEFELNAGSPPVRAIFRSDAGSLRGKVDGSSHATVVLLPRDESMRGVREILRTHSGSEGRFEIGDAPPGEYYVWAFERIDIEALRDPVFVQTLQARASTIKIERGTSAMLTLSVTPWPE